jgi:hypothetical protein
VVLTVSAQTAENVLKNKQYAGLIWGIMDIFAKKGEQETPLGALGTFHNKRLL